ncbi:CvpA family protein [Sulfurimonas aquatica]|uniref:CvpA family protein n=1 Tax=Sulfurimonas aquatica TaxID=2672570 RepID=A0A975AZX0_9BACT|nr:CvpA family protein [Sulfurimonas aquatica]QSZ41565.1 CvpA family protein [Sulfurimonas aquatica]
MDINYFDIVAASIILLLGLKGIINGFFKEVFGLVGIIGGIFVASRAGDEVGEYLNNLIFNFESTSAISFMGFLTTLAIFWLLMVLIGFIFKKLSAMSGLGPVDKILGFVFGASKFFLIAAVIAHAAYSVQAVKSSIDSALENSILFPIMVETGSFIMKMDPVNMSDDINKSISNSTQAIEEKTKKLVEEEAVKKIEEIKQELKEN